ncbi:MAG: hypothetical protein HP493_13405, partial [Nitrospira sp.]|nr:hypothetical protein [Nitrospira sp.]
MAPQLPVRQASPFKRAARPSYPDRWDLTHLVKSPPKEIDAILSQLETVVAHIETARPTLAPSITSHNFLTLLTLSETFAQGSSKLGAYAYLRFSENTKDAEARSLKARVEERLTALSNRLLFFDLWWQSVDSANAA